MEAQVEIRNKVQQVQDYVRDLYQWEKEMKRETRNTGSRPNSVPVRGGSEVESRQDLVSRSCKKSRKESQGASQITSQGSLNISKQASQCSRDKWDKFDVDAALAAISDDSDRGISKESRRKKSDEMGDMRTHMREVKSRPLTQPKVQQANSAPPARNAKTLEDWKDEGNRLFKSGRYQEAVNAYSRSIALGGGSVVFANRAMAFLKIEDHQAAEDDCTRTLELDSTFIKAWQRRGTARKAMGRFREAVEDLEYALRLCPTSRALRDDYLTFIGLLNKQQNVTGNPRSEDLVVCDEATTLDESCSRQGDAAGRGHVGASADPASFAITTSAPAVAEDEAKPMLETEEEGHPALASSSSREPASVVQGIQDRLNGAMAAKNVLPKPVTGSPVSRLLPCAVPSASGKSPPAPKTGIEFEAGWKGLRDGPSKSAYLLMVDPPTLPTLLKCSLTSPLLYDILTTVLQYTSKEDSAHAVAMLQHLCKVPRFNLAILGMSRKQKEELGCAWQSAAFHEVADEKLRDLRKLYAV